MRECVINYLSKRGFSVNTNALAIIGACDDWYSNRMIKDFHKRENLNGESTTIAQMNFAKRCCADDANLCEIIDVQPEETEAASEFIQDLLKKNRFDVMYRKQLEKTAATGTVGAYIYLDRAEYIKQNDVVSVRGGQIKINYCDADCIVPLTVENELITECAFAVTNMIKGENITTLVIFTIEDNGNYKAETVRFNDQGAEIKNEYSALILGEVKPFAILTNAEVNNLDNMEGYGLPKVYNTIPYFKALDLCYALLYGDLSKGEKLIFINELLSCIGKDEGGNPILTKQQKEVFILLGEKLPDKDSVIQEYNPVIRVEEITKVFELVLSLISMQFGYGTKKYTFENGQIKTATEYIGSKQDEMQELNKQRQQAEDYIADIVHAAMWFSNQFHKTAFDVEENLTIEFDDSFIEDKVTKLENMRTDAIQFPDIPVLKKWYIMERYNLPEDEAEGYIKDAEFDTETED